MAQSSKNSQGKWRFPGIRGFCTIFTRERRKQKSVLYQWRISAPRTEFPFLGYRYK